MTGIQNKIRTTRQILESFPDRQMGLYYLVDLGKQSLKEYPEEDRTEENPSRRGSISGE